MENLEELKKDKEQLETDFEKLREQIIGVQYVIQYVSAKIKKLEEDNAKKTG